MGMSRRASILLASSALTWAVPAFSQTQEAASVSGAPATGVGAQDEGRPQASVASDSGEIIVTATRRNETLQNVAMAVDVATGEKLQRLNIFDAKDVSQLAPGLELTNTTGRNNTTTLRGITFDPDQGTAPAVQVYFNEIPTDAQVAYTALYDVSQVEVLRGPQGLLRGLSAPAGSITIGTRRPNFDHEEGYAQLTATSRAGYNVQGGVTLPFSDTFSIRAAGLVDGNRINNVRNVNTGRRSQSRTESFRFTAGWQPSPDFTAYLTYQYLTADNYQEQQVAGPGNTPAYDLVSLFFNPPPTPDTSARSGPPLSAKDYKSVQEGVFRSQNSTHIVNLAADWNLGAATLSFVGAHQFSRLEVDRDLDPGNAVPGYINASKVIIPYKVDTGELRLTSNNVDGFGWGLGAFYTHQTGTTVVDQPGDTFFFPVLPGTSQAILGALPYLPIDSHVVVPVDTTTYSFNANARYHTGGLTIEGGLRYSIIRGKQTTQLSISSPGNFLACPNFGCTPFSIGPNEIIPANLQRNRIKPLTGGATITYALLPTLNVYAAYGHSVRAGSTGVALPAGISSDLIRTKTEKTNSYEVGLKGSLMDHRLSFTVAGYYQTINGFLSRFPSIYYQAPAASPPSGFADFNYNADAKIKGVEASVDGKLGPNFDFGVGASYAHARFSNAQVPCNDFAGTGQPNQNGQPGVTGAGNVSYCKTNGRLAEVPDFSLSANAEVRFPVGTITPFARALFTYRPGFFSERYSYDYDSRELLNLFVGLRTAENRFELNVFARNLLNQRRITNISLGNATTATVSPLSFDSGYRLVNVTNPREFGATASFRF